MKTNTNKNHYVTFVVVYETMNYNRASEILGISRQAVSQNLRELGNQLGGIKLFVHDPVNRCVTPTSEATAIYPDIKESVEKMIEVEEGLQAFTSESKAVIRMGIPSSIASILLADFFKEFSQSYPRVKLVLYNKDDIHLLEQKKIDLAIHSYQAFANNNFQVVDLFEQESIFIASKKFLADNKLKETLTKDELLKLPVVGHQYSVKEFNDANNMDLSTVVETAISEPILALTKNGTGIGYYYSKFFRTAGNNDLVKLDIKGCVLPKVRIVCCYNKSHVTKAARTFVQALKKFCSDRLQ